MENFDEKYEYNCPQFVDFSVPHQMHDDRADEYFDFDHESDEPLGFETDPSCQIPDTFEEPAEQEKQVTPGSPAAESHPIREHIEARVSDVPQPCPEPSEQTELSHKTTDSNPADNINEQVANESDRLDSVPIPESTVSVADTEVQRIEEPVEDTENERIEEAAREEEVPQELHQEVSQEVHQETVEADSEVVSEVHVSEDTAAPTAEVALEDVSCTEDVCNNERDAASQITEPTAEVAEVERAEAEEVEEEEMPAEQEELPMEPEELPREPEEMPREPEELPREPEELPREQEETAGEVQEMAVEIDSVRDSPESPEPEAPAPVVEAPKAVAPSRPKPSNIVTSWGDAPTTHAAAAQKTESRSRPVTRRATRSLNNEEKPLKRSSSGGSVRRSLRIKHSTSTSPATKKRRVLERSHSQDGARKGRQAAPAAAGPPAGPPHTKPQLLKLTMPTTPTCLKRNLTKPGAQFKTSEQLEMERIASFRKQLEERKKQSQASYRKVQTSSGYQAKKAIIQPTKPEAFVFETDSRIKPHPMATRQDAKSFENMLRKGSTSPPQYSSEEERAAYDEESCAKFNRGPTVPKPFKLTESRKRKFEDEVQKNSPFRSMATRISQFHNKTPMRYHTRRSGDQYNKDETMHQEPVRKTKLTCPKTPQLESRNRKRPVTVQSAVEKEEQELHEMQSYKFKANPVNPRVMSNLNIGLKISSHKEPTVPVGFNLESERRMREREMKKGQEEEEEQQEEQRYQFHAKPVSSKILEGVTGLAEVKPRTLTCPKSPAFALKNRVRVKEDIVEEEPKSHLIRANPIIHVGVPFKPQVSHKTTEVQPFSFERRDKQTQARKEAKIQEIFHEEEKARQFKARPIIENVSLPEKRAKPTTNPEPFNLVGEDKGAKRAEMWSKKVEEELKEQRSKATAFKAKPAEVLYNEPFIPQKPTRPLTEISSFDLNTDRRAAEREEFDSRRLQKELEERETRHRQQQLQAEEEKREIQRMRRQDMVHKAQPVKHFKPVHVLPSLLPLTEACSPNFSDRFQK